MHPVSCRIKDTNLHDIFLVIYILFHLRIKKEKEKIKVFIKNLYVEKKHLILEIYIKNIPASINRYILKFCKRNLNILKS